MGKNALKNMLFIKKFILTTQPQPQPKNWWISPLKMADLYLAKFNSKYY